MDLRGQFLMDMLDTTKEMGKGFLSMYKRFDHIRMSGYMQPQYQIASREGAAGYGGGNFSEFSNNRFMLRRGRIRFDYVRFDQTEQPKLQFVFQFDGTERGVVIRDFWGRYWGGKSRMFYVTTGMFARPFGYEVNLSSADREAPERGRMSQILMKTERDIGFMGSIEPNRRSGLLKYLKIDAGIFNGQGLSGMMEFDRYKDFIGQVMIKPLNVSSKLSLGGGVSMLSGGFRQYANAAWRLNVNSSDIPFYEKDSLTSSIGDKLPRKYFGVNAQARWDHGWGNTQVRVECWQGTQTASRYSSETPGTPQFLPDGSADENFVRDFNGAFILFLQDLGSKRHQLGIKLDWYDPNRRVSGLQIGNGSTNLNAADVRYTTLGGGYLFYPNDNLKLTLWYDLIRNEQTGLTGLKEDLHDDLFTARVQFRF